MSALLGFQVVRGWEIRPRRTTHEVDPPHVRCRARSSFLVPQWLKDLVNRCQQTRYDAGELRAELRAGIGEQKLLAAQRDRLRRALAAVRTELGRTLAAARLLTEPPAGQE